MFEFDLYYGGVRVKTIQRRASLLSALREARSKLDPKSCDCVEVYKDSRWIKEYSL